MHGQRKPRQHRMMRDPISHAILRATRLLDCEVETIINPVRECETALREGCATLMQWRILDSTMQIASIIEKSRIIKGLYKEINAAHSALAAIENRALQTGKWKQTPLYTHELESVHEAIGFHEFQLRKLSAGELHHFVNKLTKITASQGGSVEVISLEELEART